MDKEDYNENVYFDPRKNCWFIPEDWEEQYYEDEFSGGDIGDLEDALG
jgi:hypothetical protein